MAKLIGLNKIKTAVFISGTGSNLKNLINFSKTIKSPISIDLIISNITLLIFFNEMVNYEYIYTYIYIYTRRLKYKFEPTC